MKTKLFTLLLTVAASIGTLFAEKIQIGNLYYDLYATDQTAEVTYQLFSDENYSGLTTASIPASVTYNSVTYSVTSIGYAAFYNCSCLTSVTIPNSVTSIGSDAFYGCSSLTSLTIPNSVTSIGDWAFFGCSSLGSVTIPNSVTSIGVEAFVICRSLTSIDVASNNTNYSSIGGVLFNKDQTSLIQYPDGKQGAYTIPNSVTSIGETAFAFCTSLTSIDVASNNTNYSSIGGVLFNKDQTSLIRYPGGKQGAYTIPNSVTSIGEAAFAFCTSLTSVTIPNSVTSIGTEAFRSCTSLTSVTIGNNVTSIGVWAFYGCTSLISVTNYATAPLAVDSYFDIGFDISKCTLYVLVGSIDAYNTADFWKYFGQIIPITAQTADLTTTTIKATDTTADIAWPKVENAYTYELIIKDQDGNTVCTLVFNANGQLTSINFNAPAHNNAPQQTQVAGFAFTVTGLEGGETYSYTLTAKDSNGSVLNTETGSFTTQAPQGIDNVHSNQIKGTKILHDGQILILRGDKTYTVTGQEVK